MGPRHFHPPEVAARPAHRPSSRSPEGGFRFGKVFGIDLHVDWSVGIIFTLVAVGLGAGALPRWHQEWGPLLRWTVATVAALAFFASILVHELSHALVGRAFGIEIRRITLFIFGGMAHLQGEPTSAKAEFLMAAVGPLTSFVLGAFASFVGLELAVAAGAPSEHPEELVRGAGPLATILLWLGPLNVMLAVFNMIPGFPLDGGRVLRAALWWRTGDLDKATRWAAAAGQAVGWGFITIGAIMAFGFRVPFFGTGLSGGLWIALIGWFLNNAARASYIAIHVRQRLAHVHVRDVMRSSLDVVTPSTTIAELVAEHIMKTDQTSFPVLDGEELAGVVAARDVRVLPHDQWSYVLVRQIMSPASELPAIDADADASKALETLAERDIDQLPVLDHGRLSGFVRRQDILKWISLQADPTPA